MPENNINKTGGGGARRLIFTGNVKTTLFNKYTPGSGVGALNRSVRRATVPNCKGFCSNVNGQLVWTSMGRYAYYKQFRPPAGGGGGDPLTPTSSLERLPLAGTDGVVPSTVKGAGGTLTTTRNQRLAQVTAVSLGGGNERCNNLVGDSGGGGSVAGGDGVSGTESVPTTVDGGRWNRQRATAGVGGERRQKHLVRHRRRWRWRRAWR